MNPTPNKLLMPWLQALAAMFILVCFFAIIFLLLMRTTPVGDDVKDIVMPMIEVLKAVILILIGFLFGSSANSAKKDEQNAALTASLVAPNSPIAGPAPATVKIDDTTPVKVTDVPPTA